MRLLKIAGFALTALLLAGAVVVAYVAAVTSHFGACENTVYRSVTSPDGTLAAVSFERNCGATTGFNRQLAVVAVSDLKQTQDYQPFLVISGEDVPTFDWIDTLDLRVRLPTGARIIRRADTAGDVAVTYDRSLP